MGIYINPVGDKDAREKGHKLRAVAQMVSREEFAAINPGENGNYGVALVDNGPFIALAVAFSPNEARVFAAPDGRRIEFFKIHIDKIRELDPNCAAALA